MSAFHSSSSSWNTLGRRTSHHSPWGGSIGPGVIPICNCGEMVVVKMARTPKNARRYFWGCRNYKSEAGNGMCCNYFKWCSKKNDDEKDVIIGRQRGKIYDLENALKALKKKIQLLVVVTGFLSVVNIVMFCVFWLK
ncbi:uncharacterized protein LOC111242344 [Vigna radiata var. radiata]|uniref:Uncharacterized protein LOC111242344 n=1 Tax=Vigna radiata var. radiata TaxID=3916 RepID=A0A3Q0FER0_VIGRR|nr:uncharacterized protein LOC111242344 [Vigna radiata var. radiata]